MSERTVEELSELHSQMLAQAVDLGMDVPEDLTPEFTTTETGRAVVDSLEKLLKQFRAGLDIGDESKESETEEQPAPRAARLRKKRQSGKKAKPDSGKAPKSQSEESQVTEKTAKKTTKKAAAKKAPAKKAAAKKSAKSASSANARSPVGRSKYTPEMKITAVVKDPPELQKKTKWADRLRKVYAAVGKKVADFKGSHADLTSAIKKGMIKVS